MSGLNVRTYRVLLAVLLLAYLAISLANLHRVPRIYEDEPWQASAAWKLATQGVFGADPFTGFHNMESRTYTYMPLHGVFLAMVFRVAGLGLLEARLVSVACGLLVLILTYALGVRLHSRAIGLLAITLLLTVRTTAITPSQLSGILFLDVARIARYDLLVPLFGLAAVHAWLSLHRSRRASHALLAGLMLGLGMLGHPNAIFWVLALLVLSVWERLPGRLLLVLAVGALLPLLPYVVYVLQDLPAWTGQMGIYARRWAPGNPRWYLENLRLEHLRYAAGIGEAREAWRRPGVVLSILVGLAAIPVEIKNAVKARDAASRVLLVPAAIIVLGQALLVSLKFPAYLIAIAPLASLLMARAITRIWQGSPDGRVLATMRIILAVLLLTVAVEAGTRWRALAGSASKSSDFADVAASLQEAIPYPARVLGLHTYWFAFEAYDYRSWALAVFELAEKGEEGGPALAFLDEFSPEYVLIDVKMREYLTDPRVEGVSWIIWGWLDAQGAMRTALVEDETYGVFEVYRLDG